MTEHSLWRFSRAFHAAVNERQLDHLEELIDEDVDWAIYGPIDMFPFLGSRRGKLAVLDVVKQIAENFRVHRFNRESVMLGVDSASSMLRYSLTALDSNKPISGAPCAFRTIQGRPALKHPRPDRHLRSGGAGARPANPPAEGHLVRVNLVICEARPSYARCASFGGYESAETHKRVGGSGEAIQLPAPLDCLRRPVGQR